MEGSQSCQFLLRFNVRMVLTLLRVLQHTLRDEAPAPLSPGTTAGAAESSIQFGSDLLKLLPLFRLYIAWIYAARADLVQYQDYLEPQIQEVYGLLADVLTSLNLFIDPTLETVSSKYLLSEDTEAQGLRSLSDRKLPLFLHIEEQQSSTPSKRAKVRKPQQNVFGQRFKPEVEAIWRIRDIICCGAFLAGSTKFSLTLVVRKHEGRDVEAWRFVDGTAASAPSNEATLSRLLRKLGFGDLKREPDRLAEQEEAGQPQKKTPTNSHIPAPANQERKNVPQSDRISRKDKYPARRSTTYQDSDPSEDTEMVNMVNKLLDPLDGERPQSSEAQVDPSYGMHSSTANEIFGGLDMSPAQPSPVSKTLPSLPWDYFYKPTPHRSNSREQNQMSSNGHNVPRSAAGSSPYLGELSANFDRALPHGFSPRLNAGHLNNSPTLNASSPGLPRRDHGLDTLEGSRSAVLDSLTSALLAQHGLSRDSASPGNGSYSNTNVSQIWGHQNAMGESLVPQAGGSTRSPGLRRNDFGSYDERSIDHRTGTTNSPNMPDFGRTVMNTGAGHLGPSGSNNFGGQGIWGSGPSAAYPHRVSPWQQEASIASSSMGFSHPSSLFAGTPGAVPATPANAVACNGNYYNATTPFSRLGEGINNREDPTHFRNKLKAVTGASELSYDQQIMQAAMMDNNHKPRPK
jgi:protein SMG7